MLFFAVFSYCFCGIFVIFMLLYDILLYAIAMTILNLF